MVSHKATTPYTHAMEGSMIASLPVEVKVCQLTGCVLCDDSL